MCVSPSRLTFPVHTIFVNKHKLKLLVLKWHSFCRTFNLHGYFESQGCWGFSFCQPKLTNKYIAFKLCYLICCVLAFWITFYLLAGGYLCFCRPGYYGNHCEKEINECQSSPCRNVGTCLDELNGYSCKCPPGEHNCLCLLSLKSGGHF